MAMTPENYVGINRKCKDLCIRCEKIIREYRIDNFELEEEANKVYDEIIELETELKNAIRNLKNSSTCEKYKNSLENIRSYKQSIDMIAHII